MQIKVSLKVIIFVLFFCFTNQINMYMLFMFFAAIHELGHILTAICLGLKVQRLEIMPFGFGISLGVDTKNYNKKILKSSLLTVKKLIIAFAGPIVNVMFIFLFLCLNKSENFVYANILILIFNMLPIYPLDGGRILKYILCIFFGRKSSFYLVNVVSNISFVILLICSVVIGAVLKNFAYFIVAIYVGIMVVKENKAYRLKRKMYKILENNIAINRN